MVTGAMSNSQSVVKTLVIKIPCVQPVTFLKIHLTLYVP